MGTRENGNGHGHMLPSVASRCLFTHDFFSPLFLGAAQVLKGARRTLVFPGVRLLNFEYHGIGVWPEVGLERVRSFVSFSVSLFSKGPILTLFFPHTSLLCRPSPCWTSWSTTATSKGRAAYSASPVASTRNGTSRHGAMWSARDVATHF